MLLPRRWRRFSTRKLWCYLRSRTLLPPCFACHPNMAQRGVLVAVVRPRVALLTVRCFSASGQGRHHHQSIFVQAWEAYSRSLHRRPLITKATTASLIFFASDSATQYLARDEDSDFSFNVERALSGSIFGIVATVYMHVWWNFLEGAIGCRIPVTQYRLANTMVKVVIDQSLAAPFYVFSYYVVTNFIQHVSENTGPDAKSPQQILKETNVKASEMLWPTMLRHWRLWPLVHSFNFYFVPLHHRILVQNLVLVGWSGCTCH